MTPTYTATSTVLIEPRAPQVLDMRELEETQESGDVAQDTYYGTEYKILQSRSLAARVIRELNLQNELFLRAGETEAVETTISRPRISRQGSRDPSVQTRTRRQARWESVPCH